MIKSKINVQNHEGLIEIAEGIYWVGFYDVQSGLHCNPYLIVDYQGFIMVDDKIRITMFNRGCIVILILSSTMMKPW